MRSAQVNRCQLPVGFNGPLSAPPTDDHTNVTLPPAPPKEERQHGRTRHDHNGVAAQRQFPQCQNNSNDEKVPYALMQG